LQILDLLVPDGARWCRELQQMVLQKVVFTIIILDIAQLEAVTAQLHKQMLSVEQIFITDN